MFSSKRHPIWTTLISVIFVAIGLLFVTIAPEMTALGLVIYGAGMVYGLSFEDCRHWPSCRPPIMFC